MTSGVPRRRFPYLEHSFMHHRTLCGGLAVVFGGLVLVWPLATGADTIDAETEPVLPNN